MATKQKLNYKESPQLLKNVKSAKRILLACHVGADPDSIVSCLVTKRVLKGLGIEADVVVSDPVSSFYENLDVNKEIKLVNFEDFDWKKYDLFFAMDIGNLKRYGITNGFPNNLKTLVVDHHAANEISGLKINDTSYSSTSEMLFYLFLDWNIKLDNWMLNMILMGIVSDTDNFNYGVSPRLFKTISTLLEQGADYNRAANILWRNYSLSQIKFWSKILQNTTMDKKYRFVYTSLSFEDYKDFSDLVHPTRSVADTFLRSIRNTDFGITMLEYKKNEVKISIRAKSENFVMLPLLQSLGGGGHKSGGGAMISGLPFEKAVAKVLKTARQFAKENASKS